MISAVKEICIFMIIAQAVMFFVPGGSYMKYVRILVGILMILRITEPVLTFLADEETGQEIADRMRVLWNGMGQEGQELSIEDGSIGLYRGIEEELQTRLNRCQSDFEVIEVELADEEGQVIVTVDLRNLPEGESKGEIFVEPVVLGGAPENTVQEEDEELNELKAVYSGCIGINPENITIKYAGDKGSGR